MQNNMYDFVFTDIVFNNQIIRVHRKNVYEKKSLKNLMSSSSN